MAFRDLRRTGPRGALCQHDFGRRALAGARGPSGVHTGEREPMGDKLAGIAVHIGRASPHWPAGRSASVEHGERPRGGFWALLSGAGNTIPKGIPGERRLFAVEREALKVRKLAMTVRGRHQEPNPYEALSCQETD